MRLSGLVRAVIIGLVISLLLFGARFARDNYIAPTISFVHQGANGERIMKVVLITKNEAPLIRSWVLYHGNIFGFNNLHILDSSDDPDVLEFLKAARDRLGVDVTFFAVNLNGIEHQFNMKMQSIRNQCDFIIKLDTDELLTLYDPDTKLFKMDRSSIHRYLNSLPFDGDMYKAGFISSNIIERDKCKDDDNTFKTTVRFTPFTETSKKTFLNSKTFAHLDLGGHYGHIHPALERNRERRDMFHQTRLAFFHFHSQCFHRAIENNKRAIVSHRYLNGKESEAVAIAKLEAILGNEYPTSCVIHSCHKAIQYLSYLKDQESCEDQYYKEYGPSDDKNMITTAALRETIEHIERERETDFN